jgi:hypothetical protein
MNLFEKLNYIQSKVDHIQKNAKGYNFKYADGLAVLGEIRPLLVETKLLCIPFLKDIKIQRFEYPDKNGALKYEYLFESFGGWKWIDSESGETLDIDWSFAGNNDDASQAQGNALTYNERYFLLKFFKIATPTDDPDAKKTTFVQSKPIENKENNLISEAQKKLLFAKVNGKNIDKETMKLYLKKLGFETSSDIPKSKFNDILDSIDTGAYIEILHGDKK